VRLEPLNAASHGDDLFEIATVPDAANRFRYLSEEPPESRGTTNSSLVRSRTKARFCKNFEINEFYLLETGVHLTIVCHSPAAGG